jgi:large subunit ribosomal protein L25
LALLEAQVRTDVKNSNVQQIRKNGYIPAVIYGKNVNNKVISVDAAHFLEAIRTAGRTNILIIRVAGEEHPVIVREIQKDPIRSEIIHLDFQEVDGTKEIEAEVNVQLVGEAAGVKDGGVLQQSLHRLSIRALPTNIPSSIDIDITHLQVEQVITVQDIQTEGKYEINHEPTEVIASILPPKQEEEIHSGEEQEAGRPESEEGRETTAP